jgi:hypothetical protein
MGARLASRGWAQVRAQRIAAGTALEESREAPRRQARGYNPFRFRPSRQRASRQRTTPAAFASTRLDRLDAGRSSSAPPILAATPQHPSDESRTVGDARLASLAALALASVDLFERQERRHERLPER